MISKKLLVLLFILGATIKGSLAQPAYVFHDRGVEKLEAKNYVEAIKDFDLALQKDKNHAPSYCDKARAEAEIGKKDEALKNFEQAIKLKSDYADAYYYRGLLYHKLKDEKAIADFSKTIQLDPKKTDAYLKRGIFYYQKKQESDALKDFNKAIELKTSNTEVYYFRGKIMALKGSNIDALGDFNEVIKKNPLHNESLLERGKIYLKQNKLELALKDFNACITNRLSTEEIYAMRAECYLQMGKFDDALRDYNTLIDIFKTKDIKVYVMHADANFKKKDLPATIKDCNKIVSLNREYAPAYLLRAKVYVLQGKSKYVLALNDFKKVCELEPENIEAWTLRGNLLFETNKYAEAIEILSKSISIKPDAAAYYTRSKCYYKTNNKKACCSDLEKASEMGNREAKKDIGIVCL
jgi:tetratricopeptide (TPR) repeat protein